MDDDRTQEATVRTAAEAGEGFRLFDGRRVGSVVELTRHVIAAHLDVEPEAVMATQHLERDLGITRLGLVLIGLDVEDVTGLVLPFEEFGSVHTVDDLAHRIERLMSEVRVRA